MRLIVVTDRRLAEQAGRDLPITVAAAVRAGAPTILFREKDLPPDERRALAEEVAAVCGTAELIVASDVDLARHLGARTVHLAANDPWPPESDLRYGVSCHGELDLVQAAQDGAAYATLSPIFPTESKPGYGPALGPGNLADHVAGKALPVLALGGITPANAAACLAAGAAGIAVMGGVMAAPDPEAVVHALLEPGDPT